MADSTAAEPASAPGPSDEALRVELAELLKGADLAVTTEKMLRKQLEEKLGCDLTDKKQLIRAQVGAYLEELHKAQGAGDEGEEQEEEEAEEAERAPARKKSRGSGSGAGLGSVLSDEMKAFLGVESMPRPQVVKAIWAYIKENNLQDPKNKRNIICDDKMLTIFTPPITMFSMNKQLSKHCKTGKDVAGGRGGGESSQGGSKRKKSKGSDDDDDDDNGEDEAPKRKKGGGGGFTAPVKLSPALAEFLGNTGEPISRPEITKRMWAYFKSNELLDPSDKRKVLCDERLKKLTGVGSFQAFGMMKHLKQHINPAGQAAEVEQEDGDEGEEEDGE